MLILKQFNKLISTNLDKEENTGFYFILEEVKETVFEFSQVTVKVLWICLDAISLNTNYILTFISIKWHNTIV